MNERQFVSADDAGDIDRKVLSRIFEPLIADILKMIEHQVQEVHLKRPKKGVSVSANIWARNVVYALLILSGHLSRGRIW